MAKITQHSPKFGMPSGTGIVPGVKAKCENCGVEFITEGNESYCIWRINHADVGWAIICPTCGGDVHVRHPLMPESAGVKENRFTFCFVATCCFGDLDTPEVIRLRRWRDEILANSKAGRQFTAWYYPVLASARLSSSAANLFCGALPALHWDCSSALR